MTPEAKKLREWFLFCSCLGSAKRDSDLVLAGLSWRGRRSGEARAQCEVENKSNCILSPNSVTDQLSKRSGDYYKVLDERWTECNRAKKTLYSVRHISRWSNTLKSFDLSRIRWHTLYQRTLGQRKTWWELVSASLLLVKTTLLELTEWLVSDFGHECLCLRPERKCISRQWCSSHRVCLGLHHPLSFRKFLPRMKDQSWDAFIGIIQHGTWKMSTASRVRV